MGKIKVIYVEDNQMDQILFKYLLKDREDFELVGCAYHSQGLVGKLAELKESNIKVDIIVLDIDLQKLYPESLNGFEITEKLKEEYKILIYSSYDEPYNVVKAIRMGASGYVPKERIERYKDEIFIALQEISEGRTYLGKSLNHKEIYKLMNIGTPLKELSSRENEALIILCKGSTREDIANEMHISPQAVSDHIRSIRSKLKVETDIEILIKALEYREPEIVKFYRGKGLIK